MCVVLSVLQISFKLPYLTYLISRLALTPIHPPSRCFSQELVDRMCTRRAQGHISWPVDRAVDRLKATHSRVIPVDRSVDRPESRCSLVLGAVDRAVAGRLNGHFFDRWPVDRPVDRKVNFDLSASHRADLFGAYLYPISWLFWL